MKRFKVGDVVMVYKRHYVEIKEVRKSEMYVVEYLDGDGADLIHSDEFSPTSVVVGDALQDRRK